MNKKSKYVKFFGTLFAISLVSVPLTSCFNTNTNENIITDNNNDLNSNNGSINQIKKSYVEPEIKDSIIPSKELQVISVNDETEPNVYRSINEFLTNSFNKDEFKTKLSKEMFLKDIYSYLYKAYVDNRGIFSFYFNKNKEAFVEIKKDNQNNITFDLSISLKIENNRFDKQMFNFDKYSIELDGYDYLILDIDINNEQPNFIINTNNNRYFLGLSFNNVNFSFTKSEFYHQNNLQGSKVLKQFKNWI